MCLICFCFFQGYWIFKKFSYGDISVYKGYLPVNFKGYGILVPPPPPPIQASGDLEHYTKVMKI